MKMTKDDNRRSLRAVSLLARQWRGYAKKKIRRGSQRGQPREKAIKDLAQGGIYGICASHLEDALKQANAKLTP